MGNQAEELRTRIESMGARVLRLGSLGDWILVWLEKEKLLAVAHELAVGAAGLNVLEWMTCFEVEKSLAVSYFLTDREDAMRVCLRVAHALPAPEIKIDCDSVSGIWPVAQAYEAELGEFFGINFGVQSANERVSFDWGGFPLRKLFSAKPAERQADV